MLVVISPAKSLDYDRPVNTTTFTQPAYIERSAELITTLRKMSRKKVAELMNISDSLAQLNTDRYQAWATPFNTDNARQAVFAFTGDTYAGLDISTFNPAELKWAQNHLRILSGLYGLLRPLDLMQPYRLEMGTRLVHKDKKNLYEFWGDDITEGLNQQLKATRSEVLVNLASQEYFKSVKPRQLNAELVTPVFKDKKGDDYKTIGFFAKRARGAMSAWIVKNRLKTVADLQVFDGDGYRYNEAMSSAHERVFTREH